MIAIAVPVARKIRPARKIDSNLSRKLVVAAYWTPIKRAWIYRCASNNVTAA
jgi:hypothetical protein